uniref:Uncharacterized protein n=1 Tax=Anguilla anguilla TaxID=7936 RepID=A0A0E9TQL6_ANGAN
MSAYNPLPQFLRNSAGYGCIVRSYVGTMIGVQNTTSYAYERENILHIAVSEQSCRLGAV